MKDEVTFEYWAFKPRVEFDDCQHKWFEHPMLEHWKVIHSPLHPNDDAAICDYCGVVRKVKDMKPGEPMFRKLK